jgi:CBS domain-containing protein
MGIRFAIATCYPLRCDQKYNAYLPKFIVLKENAMNSAIERLLTLRVKDLMKTKVVTIPHHATMAEAGRILSENKISGAPVVDEVDRCIGVISNTDFAIRESKLLDTENQIVGQLEYVLVKGDNNEPSHIQQITENSVEQHMSPALQTIDPESSIVKAARYMCNEHIHRLLVIDEGGHPKGVVTSLDIISALVKSVEE